MSEQEQNAKPEQEQPEDQEQTLRLAGIAPVETSHQLSVGALDLAYTARAGTVPLKDQEGELEAEIFYTAYELSHVENREERPLTFVFNGGPGSSSIWLHMGAVGPKRVVMEPEGWMPSPPYRLVDNEHTWLAFTDLVFIDPVGTGYSRAAREELRKQFWSFEGDLESVGEFIRLYLTRSQRWTSPLFLAGESYGTTRAAGLAGKLVDQGVAFNGVVLISTALNLRPIFFEQGDDLPFQLFVPTYAATAWYHGKLEAQYQELDLPELLAEVEAWSEGELTTALMKGDRLREEDHERVARKLAGYIGLDPEYVIGTNLRVNIFNFCKELLREHKRSVGRLDSRFKGVEALAVNEKPEFDPSMLAIKPPYTSTFNDYLRSELGVECDLTYRVLNSKVGEEWGWKKGSLPSTGESLRGAMAKNPYMKVLVGQGYYDLATPHFATLYMISHMNIDPELRDNVRIEYYRAGHMYYLDLVSLKASTNHVREFFSSAVPRLGDL